MSALRQKILDTFGRIRERGEDGVWISLLPVEEAITRAERVESDSGELPLRGRTFAIKDNIDLAGLPTTAACPAFAYPPKRSAMVVQRLIDAGAVLIGKTNLDQFATGLERHSLALWFSTQLLRFCIHKRRFEFRFRDRGCSGSGRFRLGNRHRWFGTCSRGVQ